MTSAPATARKRKEAPLLQLNFDIDPEGQAAAYLPVRWCVNPDKLLRELQNRGFTKPHVLISIRSVREVPTYDGHTTTEREDMAVYVVPLEREMAFISFKRPGLNEVTATIVDVRDKDIAKELWKWQRNGTSGYYDNLFTENGTPDIGAFSYDNVPYLDTRIIETINVDPEMFAAERAEWRKKVVRSVFSNAKADDECHFRRREIISWVTLVLTWPFVTLMKVLVAAGAGFIGLYFVKYKSVFNPFMLSPKSPVRDVGASRYYFKKPKDRHWGAEEFQFPLFWVINPPVLLVPTLAVWLFTSMGWRQSFTAGFVIALALAAAVAGGYGMSVLWRRRTGSQSYLKARELKRLQAEQRKRAELEHELRAMACRTDLNVSVDALPKQKQTIPLRFAALKGKVCKPFAQ